MVNVVEICVQVDVWVRLRQSHALQPTRGVSTVCSMATRLCMRQHALTIQTWCRYCSNIKQTPTWKTAYVMHVVVALVRGQFRMTGICGDWMFYILVHEACATAINPGSILYRLPCLCLVWQDTTGFCENIGMHKIVRGSHGVRQWRSALGRSWCTHSRTAIVTISHS